MHDAVFVQIGDPFYDSSDQMPGLSQSKPLVLVDPIQ